jgi:hypothetical protein
MGVQALTDTAERGHLVGDVPALILVAIILAALMPRTATLAVSGRGPHKLERVRTAMNFRRDRLAAVYLFFADVRLWPIAAVI